ncbi:MAG TPA: DUF1684 domain-containing protein [Terracidiphilus sp.]|nr:DUF1684 domain-containing protein [Terracidiphilus sp.]
MVRISTRCAASMMALIAAALQVSIPVRAAGSQPGVPDARGVRQQNPSASASPAQAPSTAAGNDTIAWLHDLQAWREQRARDVDAPDGWLTLVGLEWLKSGVNSVGAAADNHIRIAAHAPDHIGLITVSGSSPDKAIVQLLAPSGGFPADLKIDGRPAREGPLNTSDEKPSTITCNGLSLVVLRRGDRFVLQIKDADSPTRTAFHGLRWFPPNPAFRVTARWIPYKPPQVEKIPTAIGTTLDMPAPGVAEFLLDGKAVLLEPVIEGGDTSKLFFILTDKTAPAATYSGGRYLSTGLPDHGLSQPGNLVLDFNRLYNPPCAYTTYATCPQPPEKNRLPVLLEAGEFRYMQ